MEDKPEKNPFLSFVEHNPFITGYGHDRFLFLQLAAFIMLFAFAKISGFEEKIGDKRMSIYLIMIPIGICFIAMVQIIYFATKGEKPTNGKGKIKKYAKLLFIPENIRSWIVILLNLIVTVAAIAFCASKGYEPYQIIDEFFIAAWEQLIFAVVAMTLVVQTARTGWLSEKFSQPFISFIIPLIVIDICFAAAHWWAYAGDIGTIAVLAVTGLAFIAIGYRCPSLGITFHFGYNVIVILSG